MGGGSGDCGHRAAAAVACAVATGPGISESRAEAKALSATLRAQVASHFKNRRRYKETYGQLMHAPLKGRGAKKV